RSPRWCSVPAVVALMSLLLMAASMSPPGIAMPNTAVASAPANASVDSVPLPPSASSSRLRSIPANQMKQRQPSMHSHPPSNTVFVLPFTQARISSLVAPSAIESDMPHITTSPSTQSATAATPVHTDTRSKRLDIYDPSSFVDPTL